MNSRGLVLTGALLFGVSCARQASAPPPLLPVEAVNEAAILDEVKAFVALGPRGAGTDGARQAAAHIHRRLVAMGIAAEIDEFAEAAAAGSNRFRNVIGRVPGADGLLIVAAHYDTKTGVGERFVGANDSGSGVGILLALGAALRAHRAATAQLDDRAAPGACGHWPAVWFAFLDGEECRTQYGPADGLHGSRRLARQIVDAGGKERVRALILLDMVGDRDLSVTIPRNSSPELIAMAFKAAEEEGIRQRFSLFPGGILDDHQPFLDAGIPAVDLIDFQYGSAPGLNDYWHTEADTMDKLSAESLGRVARVTVRMLNALAREAAVSREF